MAKKLTKALRGKRRWFGVVVSPKITTREELDKSLKEIHKSLPDDKRLRLMDFYKSGEEVSLLAHSDLQEKLPKYILQGNEGLAIIEVPHESSNQFRTLIEGQSGMEKYSFSSVTMSGKIRLVRDRLNLPKPQRKR